MKNKIFVCLLACTFLGLAADEWQIAQPGYHYEFPRDHFEHPSYRTEWWYYTGNLRRADGHRFGFELTFFRQAVKKDAAGSTAGEGVWQPDQLYLAHFAVSDIDGGEFFHTERLNRAGPGLAGASLEKREYWNGNWHAHWTSLTRGEQELQAVCEGVVLKIHVKPEKPFVINGENGISKKGPQPGQASHYISFTRLAASGELEWKKSTFPVTGLAWMDHEFFSEPAAEGDTAQVVGWDWFAIQLNNNEELMLYRLRREAGGADPFSSGTFVDANGAGHFLSASEFTLSSRQTWRSPDSSAQYPMNWEISVPSLQLKLQETTALPKQELFTKSNLWPIYWEGAVSYKGEIHVRPVGGIGYLEMTGYAKAFRLGGK